MPFVYARKKSTLDLLARFSVNSTERQPIFFFCRSKGRTPLGRSSFSLTN